MFRNTYVEVNLTNIKKNVQTFIKKYNNYKYYIGVVKADSYGHFHILTVKSIVDAGCNYLAVSSLEEAIEIRKHIASIPILCLETIAINFIPLCLKYNITITISSKEYLNELLKINPHNLKVHLKVDTGMNRLGINNEEDITTSYNKILNSNLILEGIYTHIYNATDENDTNKQFQRFEEDTKNIDLKNIPIVHLTASDATMRYEKRPYQNGCRIGIAIYGLQDTIDNDFLSTFSLYSKVLQINEVNNETVGYNGAYKTNGKELIAVIPIGYADGIIRKNTGRGVYINNKEYPIVGNICMDMLFVKVDESVKIGDKVTIIKDIEHIRKIAKHLDTITYEVICSIGKRVPRIYVE